MAPKLTKRKQTKCKKKAQEIQTDSIRKVTTKKKQKTYTKKRFTYSQEVLKEAIAVVNSKTCSITRAAKQYGIPVGTLFNKVNGKVPLERRMGPSAVLTAEEERKIKQWILDKAEIGYPMHHMIVREAVKSVLDKINRPNPFKNNLPGDKWLKLFLGRHPEIKNKRIEMLSRVRAAVTEPRIRAWFQDVTKYLTEVNAMDVLNDPSRIYNMDETGVCLCPTTGKLLAPVKQKNVYCISPGQDRQQITVLCCFSASGVSVRPMIMYPYKRSLPKEIITSVPDGYAIGHSETGWMTTPAFYEYIVNCFYPQLLRNSVKFPVILFFDGHSSHISIELHDFCVEKQIILYCFIAHASHIMQPLDVGFFRPFKVCWRKAVAKHAQESNKVITKVNFASIFHEAYSAVMTNPTVIHKSFERSGIYPFDVNKVDYSKCITYRKEAIKNSLQSPIDTHTQIIPAATSINIESQIPADTLKEFEHHLLLGTEPAQEKILFSIWKKTKQPNVIESTETAVVSNEYISENVIENVPIVVSNHIAENVIENVPIVVSNNIAENVIENMPTMVLNYIPENVIENLTIINLEDPSMKILDHCSLANNVSLEFIDCQNIEIKNNQDVAIIDIDTNAKESSVDRTTFNATAEIEMVSPQIHWASSQTDNTLSKQNTSENSNDSGLFTEELNNSYNKTVTEQDIQEVLDLSNSSKFNYITRTPLTLPSLLNNQILPNPFSNIIKQPVQSVNDAPSVVNFSKVVKNDIQVKTELLDSMLPSEEYTNEIWKETLHFPRIETSKINKKKVDQAPIYALTSEQWKTEFKKKREEEEKLQQEKELRKKLKEEEKILKQKIKQEETENKKKIREEEKIHRQTIKQEEAESKRKAKEEEKLKKIEAKQRQKEEERQKQIKEKEQQKIGQRKRKVGPKNMQISEDSSTLVKQIKTGRVLQEKVNFNNFINIK